MNKTFLILFFIILFFISGFYGFLIGQKVTSIYYDEILRENISICLNYRNIIIQNDNDYPTIKINTTKWDTMN
jgi:hypothetical protein